MNDNLACGHGKAARLNTSSDSLADTFLDALSVNSQPQSGAAEPATMELSGFECLMLVRLLHTATLLPLKQQCMLVIVQASQARGASTETVSIGLYLGMECYW